jgi:molybdate transport system ATP-binding protein
VNPLSFDCRHHFRGGFQLHAAFQTAHQVTALFGPSGSGKSSVLNIIAGLVAPRSGRVSLGQQTLLDTARGINLKPEERQIGFVFQDHLLFPHLSVQGNLLYGQRRRRRGASTIELARVVEVLELGELLARYPRSLSGGERQRVALGRSLLSGPRLLLMDEPLAALDEALKDRILTYLERVVAEWHIPTIYVSHVGSEVQRLAQWVVVLDQGRVKLSGPPEEVFGRG